MGVIGGNVVAFVKGVNIAGSLYLTVSRLFLDGELTIEWLGGGTYLKL